jgi:hypothetical protein
MSEMLMVDMLYWQSVSEVSLVVLTMRKAKRI